MYITFITTFYRTGKAKQCYIKIKTTLEYFCYKIWYIKDLEEVIM